MAGYVENLALMRGLNVFNYRLCHHSGGVSWNLRGSGSLAALWVPMEYIAIVGLTVGAFVAGNDIKIIKATIGALQAFSKARVQPDALRRSPGHAFSVLAKVRRGFLMSI